MTTPADTSVKLKKSEIISEDNPKEDNILYRQAVGSLMYLMLGMRPDISFAVNKVAQYSTCYDNTHWTAMKRIFRYIKGTANHTLILGGSNLSRSSISLSGSCDADWAGDLDDRRSTTGYLFHVNHGCISWQTHKQASVATSSMQAEYQALSTATKEAIWLWELLKELNFAQQESTPIQQDNQSTIALAHNPINHGRTKHIDVQHHFIRKYIENGNIHLEYCPMTEMVTDSMTIALPRAKFKQCVQHMKLVLNM